MDSSLREGKRNLHEESSKRVLVMDCSSVLRRRLKAALSDRPDIEFVDGSGDALDTIRLVRELKPDAVIMDLLARRRFGIDLPRNIKKIEPAPLVVMLTNSFCSGREKKSVETGVDFFFDKFSELEKVSTIFARSQRRSAFATADA